MSEMTVFEAIHSLRAVRKYRPDPVPLEDVARILRAGTMAASSGNTQPWEFVVVTDPTLKRRILDELPGIFRWALEGLDRLTKRGHFVQPESGDDARESMERSSSPVGAFIDDRVEFALSVETSEDYLYGQYRDWCAANGHEAGAKTTFIENLISYSLGLGHSEVRKSRPGQRGEARARCVTGVRVAVPSLSGVVALHGDGPGPRFGAQPALWNDRRAA